MNFPKNNLVDYNKQLFSLKECKSKSFIENKSQFIENDN